MTRDIASATVQEVTSAVVSGADIHRLVGAIVSEFGGEIGLAKEVHQEYNASEPGSSTRSRLLLDVMKLVNAVGPAGEDDGASAEDLEALLKHLTANEP